MNRHIEKAKELRSPQKCYNCAETIMMAYADPYKLTFVLKGMDDRSIPYARDRNVNLCEKAV